MFSRTRFLLLVCIFSLTMLPVRAQHEGQPPKPGDVPPPGVDKRYWDLTHSKDPKTKGLAERYLGLVKYQQWSDASGKFSVMAKYVSHEADLSKVKLSVPKGSGKERTIKEVDVDVEKLSKMCQARVKQIDTLQKRLDELAAAAPPNPNEPGGPGAVGPGGIGPEGQGGERAGYRRGPGQGPEGPPIGPGGIPGQPSGPGQAAAPENDPSASEPDPLGFAELPPVTATSAPGPGGLPPSVVNSIIPPKASGPAGSVDRTQWRNNFDAFVANLSVTTDPNGGQVTNWGEMNELREMNELAKTPQRGPESATFAQISERLGDVHWQVTVDQVAPAPGGMVDVHFHPTTLPQPLELAVALDEKEQPTAWASVAPGSTVNVLGRLVITEPNKISLKVRMAPTR